MQRYLLRRAMQLVPIMLGVSIITFFSHPIGSLQSGPGHFGG